MHCGHCNAEIEQGLDICPTCERDVCYQCSAAVGPNDTECPACGAAWTLVCPSCDSEVLATDLRCRHCGEELDDVETVPCPHCGAEMPADEVECQTCGEERCPKCKRPLARDTDRCPFCGLAFSVYCSVCGTEIDADATECPECGTVFEEDQDTDAAAIEDTGPGNADKPASTAAHTDTCPACGSGVYIEDATCLACGQGLCPRCGAAVADEEQVCAACGLDLYFTCPSCGFELLVSSEVCPDCDRIFRPALPRLRNPRVWRAGKLPELQRPSASEKPAECKNHPAPSRRCGRLLVRLSGLRDQLSARRGPLPVVRHAPVPVVQFPRLCR